MLRKLWMLPLLLLPAFSMAADNPQPLKFFDSIPGQQNHAASQRVSGKDLDILLESWTQVRLRGDDPFEILKAPVDSEAKSKLMQRLIEYRMANRLAAGEDSEGELQPLSYDLQWAARNGYRIQNAQELLSLDQKLSGMSREEQFQFAQRVPGTLGESLLDASLTHAHPEVALRFLIQNPQALSPERRDTLIFKNLGKLEQVVGIEPFATYDMTLVRKAASLLNYKSRHTLCRTAADAFKPPSGAGAIRGNLREFYDIGIRGLVEMKKQKVDCRDYVSAEQLTFDLETIDEMGYYGKGFFSDLIQRLNRGEIESTTNAAQNLVPNEKLSQCLIDKVYSNEVEVELNKTEKMPVGGRALFGALSKAACKLAVDVTRTKKGFKAYIVLDASSGATLMKFDRNFETVQQIKNAAILGISP